METFLKCTALVLVTAVLCIVVAKRDKEIGLLVTLCACCVVAIGAFGFLKPVIDFIHKLQSTADLDADLTAILLKTVGIGLLAEISGMICTDAGNASLAKVLQYIATAVILWLSLPLFSSLLSLVSDTLERV